MAAKNNYIVRLVKSKGKDGNFFWKSIAYDMVEVSRAVGTMVVRFQIEGKVTGEEESLELKVMKNRGDITKELRIKDGKYKSASIGLWFKDGVNENTQEKYAFNSSPNVDTRELEDKIGRIVEFRMFINSNRSTDKAPHLSMYVSKKAEKGSQQQSRSATASPATSGSDDQI